LNTPNLALTHILQSQAQKEVTANAAFDGLDNSANRALSLDLGDADLTLVADQANRNGLIIFTGTLTATRTVTLPANHRRLAVRNATTGGFAVTVKYPGAGANVAVAPDTIGFTNEATSLMPYAPVHIRGSRNGAGDLTIIWVRRTRYGGAWRDLVDVPLNEASEAYEIDILDGIGAVLRTLTSTSPTVTYTAADQTIDFGAPQTSIDIAVHQLSAAVGRGFAGRATL
jgi:hypothetical protein